MASEKSEVDADDQNLKTEETKNPAAIHNDGKVFKQVSF